MVFPAPLPEDCTVILSNNASASSGVYTIQASGETTSVDVYCDMVTAGGGWTVGGLEGGVEVLTGLIAVIWSSSQGNNAHLPHFQEKTLQSDKK